MEFKGKGISSADPESIGWEGFDSDTSDELVQANALWIKLDLEEEEDYVDAWSGGEDVGT